MKVKRWQIHLTLGYLALRLPIPYVYQIENNTNFEMYMIPIGILIPVWYQSHPVLINELNIIGFL